MKWTKCSNLPVAIIWGHACVINDTLYIGGICKTDHYTYYDDYFLFSYKLTDDQWKTLPSVPHHVGVPANIQDQLSYIGGYDPFTNIATNKVITLRGEQWITYYPKMIEARKWPVAVSYQHYTIVAGGVGKDHSELDTIEVFNCNNYQWTIISTCLPQPMDYISATICNQSFIINGYTDANNRHHNQTFIIALDSLVGMEQSSLTSSTSKDDNGWSELCQTPYWNSAIVPNTSPPVIIGGRNEQDKAFNNIFLYDESTDSWKVVSSLPISCAAAIVANLNNGIIVAAGYADGSTGETLHNTSLNSVMFPTSHVLA